MNNNPNGTTAARDAQVERELNDLRRQYEQLNVRKIQTEQQVIDLSGRLEALKAQALADYGTSDPEELQALLETKRLENERVVADYREHVQQIQAELAAVENQTNGA